MIVLPGKGLLARHFHSPSSPLRWLIRELPQLAQSPLQSREFSLSLPWASAQRPGSREAIRVIQSKH